ncbi:MAG TPA: STAS domain-containing protein [Solirubrobacteraceae bacterium]|nr:STAS domain-containing protein [Solirubrobacteraceae bacterium]
MTAARVELARRGGAVVATMVGEVDLATASPLEDDVVAALAGATALVVDLSAVGYFDSAGVRLLDRLAARCADAGLPFAVVAPEAGRARFVLRVVAFGDDLVAETVEAALAAADPGPGAA